MGKAKANITLETDELGQPELPNFTETGQPALEEAKALIRAFLTAHYRKPIPPAFRPKLIRS